MCLKRGHNLLLLRGYPADSFINPANLFGTERQVTPKLIVGSAPNLNMSEISYLSSLSERFTKIQSKLDTLS